MTDDNLNYSPVEPISDRLRRVTPTLALGFDSPRWSARVSCGLDSEQYANHPALDARRARQRAVLTLHYTANPRLTLSLGADYLDTSTLAELNDETGLAATRQRGRRIGVNPSMGFRISPTSTLTASAAAGGTNVMNGTQMRSQMQSLTYERLVTAGDVFGVEWQRSRVDFIGDGGQSVDSQSVLAVWTHNLGMHNRFVIRAGPRFNDRSPSLDVSAAVDHRWKHTAVGLALLRNQATVVGHVGAVQSESARVNLAYTWNRKLNAYLSPAVFRTTEKPFRGIVYRVSAGTRYALTTFLSADVAWSHDIQDGAIDPAWPDARFSHSTLSFGLITSLNNPGATR